MRQADPVGFFANQDSTGELLQQRSQLIAEHPRRHLAHTPEAEPLRVNLHEQIREWGLKLPCDADDYSSLARQLEPDFLLLDQASQKLVAAGVCFPSSWDPARRIGEPLTRIHDIVPRLNPQIGPMIERFLGQLGPGKAYRRANWSFTRGADLNHHPALKRPPIDTSTPIDEIHLRLEHQIFTAIPGGILMGVRIEPVPLKSLAVHPALWRQLLQKVETMPPDVVRYKNLHRGISSLIRQMREIEKSLKKMP